MADAEALRLVMLGPPGSGKGTQAEILARRLGIPAISTGEMLRQAVERGSELGRQVETILAEGRLVDDETMAAVVRQRLAAEDARDGHILDGYPRTLEQARDLEGILEELDAGLDAAVKIDVPEAELVRRMLERRRADDTQEVVQQRLDVYEEKTRPLVDYYDDRGLLRRVDGHRPIPEVAEGIVRAVRDGR